MGLGHGTREEDLGLGRFIRSSGKLHPTLEPRRGWRPGLREGPESLASRASPPRRDSEGLLPLHLSPLSVLSLPPLFNVSYPLPVAE